MKKHRPTPPQPTTVNRAWSPLAHWSLLGFCLLFATGSTWGVMEFVVGNKLPGELVGKWVVQEGDQEGATFDFFRNGTMVGRVNVQGKLAYVNAAIRVEEKKMYSTTQNPNTGKQDTRVQSIRTLSATQMVLEDEQGRLLKLERAE
jgi:hypothetical protein